MASRKKVGLLVLAAVNFNVATFAELLECSSPSRRSI